MNSNLYVFAVYNGINVHRARATMAESLEDALLKLDEEIAYMGSPRIKEVTTYEIDGDNLRKLGTRELDIPAWGTDSITTTPKQEYYKKALEKRPEKELRSK